VLGLRSYGWRRVERRVVEIPVAQDLRVAAAGEEIVARRHLTDPGEERAVAVHDAVHLLVDALVIPLCRHARREECLRLRGEVQGVTPARVVEGLDPEAITRGEEQAVRLVPEHEGELAAQVSQAVRALLLVEMEDDLAVRARPQPMATIGERALVALVVVELAVHDDVERLVLVGDRLVAG
jgi:hypothetical protein